MALRDRLLAHQLWYHTFKEVIRADTSMKTIVQEHVLPVSGERLLDVGCGDGDIRPFLGDVDYVGVDANEDYLRVARERTDDRTRFIAADVTDLAELGVKDFDVAIAIGLLHHLSTPQVQTLLGALAGVIRPGGRLITVDPVFDPEQRTTARVLASLYRGRYVRDADGYMALVGQHFEIADVRECPDFLWIPYSNCVTESTVPTP